MALLSFKSVLDEIREFLRNNLVDPKNRGSDTTENFIAIAGQTQFTLANYPFNIKSVTINSSPKKYGFDYTIDYASKKVILNNGANVGDNVSITYHYGDTWIYDDFPRLDLNPNSYPRIGIKNLARSDDTIGLSMAGLDSAFSFQIGLFYDDRKAIIQMIDTITQLIWNNRLSFYNFSGITVAGAAGPGIDMARKGEIYAADMDVIIPLVVQA